MRNEILNNQTRKAEENLLQLLYNLEALAKTEGLRESPTVLKIPTNTQQEIDSKMMQPEISEGSGYVKTNASGTFSGGHEIVCYENTVVCHGNEVITN